MLRRFFFKSLPKSVRVCICAWLYMHVCGHTYLDGCGCICVCAHTVCVCVYTCLYEGVCTHVCTCMHMCVYICGCLWACLCICVSTHVYLCMYVCVCVWIRPFMHVFMNANVCMGVMDCINGHRNRSFQVKVSGLEEEEQKHKGAKRRETGYRQQYVSREGERNIT